MGGLGGWGDSQFVLVLVDATGTGKWFRYCCFWVVRVAVLILVFDIGTGWWYQYWLVVPKLVMVLVDRTGGWF